MQKLQIRQRVQRMKTNLKTHKQKFVNFGITNFGSREVENSFKIHKQEPKPSIKFNFGVKRQKDGMQVLDFRKDEDKSQGS